MDGDKERHIGQIENTDNAFVQIIKNFQELPEKCCGCGHTAKLCCFVLYSTQIPYPPGLWQVLLLLYHYPGFLHEYSVYFDSNYNQVRGWQHWLWSWRLLFQGCFPRGRIILGLCRNTAVVSVLLLGHGRLQRIPTLMAPFPHALQIWLELNVFIFVCLWSCPLPHF